MQRENYCLPHYKCTPFSVVDHAEGRVPYAYRLIHSGILRYHRTQETDIP